MTEMPDISGLYEAHLNIADLDRSIAFYRDVVGLEFARRIEARNAAFFWIGGKQTSMLGLWETGSSPMRMRLHIALRMELAGVLAAPAALRAKGVTPLGFAQEPVDEPVVIGWMPAVSLYFADPDGHSIEYICVLDEPADAAFGIQPYSAWLTRGRGETA